MNNKILLSTITTLVLLLNGCGGGGTESGGDVGIKNPIPPIAGTPNPAVPTPDPVVPDPVVPDPIVPTPDPYKTAGWYGKTQVSATASDGTVYAHKTAGVFGELVQSDDAKDQHDINGYGSAIFQVVFPQTEWEDDNGDYFSNYQNYDEESNEKRVWTFQIKNQHTVNLASASISISLDGVYDVKYKEENGKVEYKESKDVNKTMISNLTLVDVDNQTEYAATDLNTTTLGMDGLHTRTFRWVLGAVDSSDYAALAKTSAMQTKSFSTDETVTFKTQSADVPQSGGKFGLPPQ